MNKIKRYFVFDWIVFSILCIVFCCSLVNYLSNGSFIFLNFNWEMGIIVIAVLCPIYFGKLIISTKLRERLIVEIIEEMTHYSFIVYNRQMVEVDKLLIPFKREKADYFLNNLFSSRMGTINFPESRSERFTIRVNDKKYYLVPPLFENDEPMLPLK